MGVEYTGTEASEAGHIVRSDDLRLTNSRDPNTHAHLLSDVTDAGTIATMDFWTGTQAAYDALTPDPNTIYFVS